MKAPPASGAAERLAAAVSVGGKMYYCFILGVEVELRRAAKEPKNKGVWGG